MIFFFSFLLPEVSGQVIQKRLPKYAALYYIDWNRSTLNQLVQSGNLRYFKNKDLVNKINHYYASQNVIANQNEKEHELRMEIVNVRNKILQSRYYIVFSKMDISQEEFQHVPDRLIDSLLSTDLPLQKAAPDFIDEYINLLADRKLKMEFLVNNFYPNTRQEAIDIMNIIKTEYHLK